jgi:hypothetical protein
VHLSRKFGLPRLLDVDEHVWLRFRREGGARGVSLNSQRLSAADPAVDFAIDCTPLLRDRNQLDIELREAAGSSLPSGEAWLEIRKPAYLQNPRVRSRADGRFVASVEPAGCSAQPLDLYLLGPRRTLGRLDLSPGVQSGRVELDCEAIAPADLPALRWELVQGGVVWYQVSCVGG